MNKKGLEIKAQKYFLNTENTEKVGCSVVPKVLIFTILKMDAVFSFFQSLWTLSDCNDFLKYDGEWLGI